MKKTTMIRHRIMAQMYRAGGSCQRVPSVRDLAREYGMAVSTVQLALKELVDERYLIPRRGIGLFTNPCKMAAYEDRGMPPLVGIMAGDGRFFFSSKRFWITFRAIADAVFASGWNLRSVQLSSNLNEEAARELLDAGMDALIWIGAYNQQGFLNRLKEGGLKVIADSSALTGVDLVIRDHELLLASLLKKIKEEKFQSVLLAQPPEVSFWELPQLKQAAKAHHCDIEIKTAPFDLLDSVSFAPGSRVLVVSSDYHRGGRLLREWQEKNRLEIEVCAQSEAVQDGRKGAFLCGKIFADAVTGRLREMLAGDSVPRIITVPEEFFPDTPDN